MIPISQVVPDSRPAHTSEVDAIEIPLGEEDVILEDDGDAGETPAAQAIKRVFNRVPLFSSLDEARLRLLIERIELVRLDPGQTLFNRGDRGDALFVVTQGEVEVLAAGDMRVARLGEGSFFGEIALLTEQPRSASIRATVETDLLSIGRDAVGELIEGSPDVLKVLLRFMRDRLIETLVRTNPLFGPFSGDERQSLAKRFRFLEIEPNALLLEQGKRAPGLFVVLAGNAECSVDGKAVATLAPGDLFGETSLLTHEPARASIRASSKGYVLQLPRSDFQEVIMTHPHVLEYVNTVAEARQKLIDAVHLPVT
jgi:CRP-like cAMP-binding protein